MSQVLAPTEEPRCSPNLKSPTLWSVGVGVDSSCMFLADHCMSGPQATYHSNAQVGDCDLIEWASQQELMIQVRKRQRPSVHRGGGQLLPLLWGEKDPPSRRQVPAPRWYELCNGWRSISTGTHCFCPCGILIHVLADMAAILSFGQLFHPPPLQTPHPHSRCMLDQFLGVMCKECAHLLVSLQTTIISKLSSTNTYGGWIHGCEKELEEELEEECVSVAA